MAITIHIENIEMAVRKLQQLREVDRREYRKIKTRIKKAAKPMKEAIKAAITDSQGNRKFSRLLGRGKDRKTGLSKSLNVTYRPGNLKRSIDIMMSTRGRSLVVNVGARFGRKATANADGYYAAMVQYGTNRGGKRGLAKARGDRNYKNENPGTLKETQNKGYVENGFDMGKDATTRNLQNEIGRILQTSIYRLSS